MQGSPPPPLNVLASTLILGAFWVQTNLLTGSCAASTNLPVYLLVKKIRVYQHAFASKGVTKEIFSPRKNSGGKQWQTTPKNLPRMQCARAIPVIGLGFGFCQPGL